MRGGGESGAACTAIAERSPKSAVEDDHLAGHRELMDEAAVVDIVLQIGVGGVHRTRDGAGPIALGLLAQIDQRNPPPDKTLRFVSRISPAVQRHLLLVQPLAHVRRTATSIIFGSGRRRLAISAA